MPDYRQAVITLRSELHRIPVSQAVMRAQQIAQDSGDREFARWCRLELQGYYRGNPAMTNDTHVPEYRSVIVQHQNRFGQPLTLPPDFAFMSQMWLRFGVEELERFERERKTITVHDPQLCKEIMEYMHGDEVYSHSFSSTLVTGVLSSIRTELAARLAEIRSAPVPEARTAMTAQTNGDVSGPELHDIIEVKPSLFGISLNVLALGRATWRWWKRRKQSI